MDQLINARVDYVLLVALGFYLLAGWRTFQVMMLTSDRRDPAAQDYAAGNFPLIAKAGFVVLWVPILASTFAVAWGEKLAAYHAIPSLRAYLIVDHRRRRVERHSRTDATAPWVRDEVVGEGSVPVPWLDVELALDVVYHRVDLATIAEPDAMDYGD